MTAAVLGFLAVFFLAFMRIPLAVAMSISGLVGLGLLRGWQPAFASTSQVIFETGFHYVLSVIPLFVLMPPFFFNLPFYHVIFPPPAPPLPPLLYSVQ